MSEVGKLYILFDADGKPYIKGLKDIEGKTSSTASHLEKTMGKAGKVMSQALAGGAVLAVAAIGSIAVASVKAAASFEYEMSRIKAVSGATAKEFESLRGLALQLGKDTVFSAGEAAQALTELSKAGISVNDILGGAAAGTLALASAGELDVARAAEIAANSMNMFGLAGKDVMSVADALASAANASSLEVNDLAEAFKFIGPVANQMGISFQQVIAMIAELGNQGIKGEAAGTGLRTMLMSLAAPSAIASKAMEQYGVSAYDATGKIKPVPELLDHLKAQLQGLTQQQQMGLLEKVFGREGASASLILIGQGSEKLAEMQAIVSKTGEASRVAATKLDNLMGSWEQLKGSAETLAISIGTKALPMIRGFVDEMTTILNEALETGDFSKLGERMGQLIGDGIRASAPYVVDAAWELGKGVVKATDLAIVAAMTGAPTGSDFSKMSDYVAERMAGAYKDIPKNEAFQKALVDLQSYWSTSFLKGRSMFVPVAKTADEVLALGRAMGIVFSDAELKNMVALGLDPAKLAAYQKEQLDKANAELTTLIQSTGGRSLSFGFDALIPTFEAVVPAVSTATRWAGQFNAALAETPEYVAAATAAVDGLTGSISGMLDDQTALNAAIKDGTFNLKDYLKEVQKQLDAETNWEKNIRSLAWQFNGEFGPEVIRMASQRGPEFVAALVGANEGDARKALASLQTIMDRTSPEYVAQIWREVGAYSGDAAGKAAVNAAGEYSESFWAELTRKMGGGYQGWLKAISYMGLAPFSAYGIAAGGATAAEIMKSFALQQGKVGGLAGTTGNVWTSLHSIFPNATWMGGYATSGHVTNSDHYTGHAFDTGGSPALMQDMANLLARNMEAWGLKYVIYNRQVNRGGGWVPYAGSNPHTDHVHVSTYDQGGVLPPGLTLASNFTGQNEVVVPASLTLEIRNLIKTLEKSALMGAFSGRSSLAGSYISRESARYGMYEAQGAPIELLESTLKRKIELINAAVAEAQAQLDAAKAQALPQEEINQLAEALFNLRTDAAGAKSALEALARTPLEAAASRWSSAISQLSTMMDLVGNSSNASALQNALFPSLMGAMGGQYQANVDLMNTAGNTPDQIMGYGSAAMSSLSSMFGAEQTVVNRTLSETLASIDSSQASWEAAWSARASAVEENIARQSAALQKQLADLQSAQQEELDALNQFYNDKLQAMADGERAITREQQRNQDTKQLGGLEDQLRILQGQGYYTEADIAKMRDLETQIQDQRDGMTQQEDAWRREDERLRLEAERDAALRSLEQQQEAARIALEDQIQAAQAALEAQRQAMEQERIAQQQAFDKQREQARVAAQAEIDKLVEKYQKMMQTVMDQQTKLLGQAGAYQNAGYALGQAFAQGLMAALPAIQAAANAAAATAAASLKLRSPAKVGPLSDLDHWFDAFVPTLLRPLDMSPMSAAANSIAGGTKGGEDHLYVHLDGNAAGMDIDDLADKLAVRMQRKVTVRAFDF